MATRSGDVRRYVNELWDQALDQLEDAREAIIRSRDRLEADVHRLKLERDKLLTKLGQQTLKLSNQGRLPVPRVVQKTVDKLNHVINKIVDTSETPGQKHPNPSKPAVRTTTGAAHETTTVVKKTAKKATKKTAKKATKKATGK